MSRRVMFLVNGGPDSAMAIRARSFAERIGSRFQVEIRYRTGSKFAALLRFVRDLFRARPCVCYVFDIAWSGVIAGLLHRAAFRSSRLIVDTGDAVTLLATAMGRGRVGLALTRLMESAALRHSDGVVVRSHFHRDWLCSEEGVESYVIPDGVSSIELRATADSGLRARLGLEGFTTVGILGSLIPNRRTGHCYGLEIIEALRILRDPRLRGVIIGDGPGLPMLKKRAADLGLADSIVFTGRVPYSALGAYLRLIDICVSTQTNDLPGRVRTTGKLPLYLAAGRYVLATDVGEASLILPPPMRIPYRGAYDENYPQKLAAAIRRYLEGSVEPVDTISLAQQNFEYDVLAPRLTALLDALSPCN